MKEFIHTKQFIIIALVVMLVLFAVVGWFALDASESKNAVAPAGQTDAQRFAVEYPKAGPDNPFVYASEDKILSTFDSGTGLVFLGFTECPWCQHLVGIVDQAAQAESFDTVQYLNIREARQSKSDTYDKLVAHLEQYLDKDDDGKPIIYVPDVTAIKDGKIVGRFEMEKAPESESSSPEAFWTDARKQRAVAGMQDLMRSIR